MKQSTAFPKQSRANKLFGLSSVIALLLTALGPGLSPALRVAALDKKAI